MQSSGKKTIFTYDTLGTKLRKQEYTGTTLTLTNDYLGSVQYLNGTSQFAATAEGRVYNNSGTFRYDYFMKDQVGNIRMTYTANGTGVTVLQRDEYYPFGNTFDSYLVSGSANNYKFNGMEFEENNLNTFDFHARMYDPQIGRSFQPDPLADRFVSKSPYSFLANNPVMYTDPTGMTVEPSDDRGGDGQGGFGSIGPSTTLQWGSWFLNNTMNYRGGNGFLAAFRGDGWGNRRSRYVPMNTNQLITTVERFKDWYFSSKYTGTHYIGTEFLGSYLIINQLENQYHDDDYLTNQVLYGVNIWDHENHDWSTGRMEHDDNYSESINKLRMLGIDCYINPSGLNYNALVQQNPTAAILSWTDWMRRDAPFPFPVVPMTENEFNKQLNKGQLDSRSTYFRFRSGFESDGVTPIVQYGFIRDIYFDPKKY